MFFNCHIIKGEINPGLLNITMKNNQWFISKVASQKLFLKYKFFF